MKYLFILLLLTQLPFFLFTATLQDNPSLKSLDGTWKLLESNYYLGDKLLDYKGDMNIVFSITVKDNIMKWISNTGITKTFFFDFESNKKTITTPQYQDSIESSLTGTNKLIHTVFRKYLNGKRTMNVRNSFELKLNGKTMHHIFEDFNGKQVYKVYSIYGRDIKSVLK